MKDLGRLDVNALRTLVAIYDSRSFTEGARRLGVNQSTASYTMKLLRESFGDPLFVRLGNAVEPTERCREVLQRLRPVLDQLESLAASGPFDPAEAEGEMVISCNYHERRSLVPDALREIRRVAPRLRVHFHEASVHGKRQLMENVVDIVLGAVAITGDVFYRRRLLTDRYVCVMDRDHPAAQTALTLEVFQGLDHLAITHNGLWQSLFYPVLRAQGIHLTPAVTVPVHDNVEGILTGSTLVATIPERLTTGLPAHLVLRPFPVHVPIEIDMYWTERTHNSGPHKWVRQIFSDTAAKFR